MAALVRRVIGWLPPAWQSAIERESREWRSRCPRCLHETSVWDMGGIRFKAAGNPVRSLRCRHCSTKFLGQLYRVTTTNDAPRINAATENYAAAAGRPTPIKRGLGTADFTEPARSNPGDCRLWIDGAGCYLVLMSAAVTVGSPSRGADRPDVAIMAGISRRQAQIIQGGEGWLLVPLGSESPGPRKLLRTGEPFDVGGGVQLRLRVPNPLSQTAVLEIASSHRVEPRCDGVILLDQVCVLGPGADAHIRNAHWPTPLILFRRQDQLWCKAVPSLQKNGQPVSLETPLENGDVLTTEDLRLRVELSCGS